MAIRTRILLIVSILFATYFTNASQNNRSNCEYNQGRWTEDEHTLFETAFDIHGRDWKKIAKYVGTRSNVQARTHYQKLERMRERHQEKIALEQSAAPLLQPLLYSLYNSLPIQTPDLPGCNFAMLMAPLSLPCPFCQCIKEYHRKHQQQ